MSDIPPLQIQTPNGNKFKLSTIVMANHLLKGFKEDPKNKEAEPPRLWILGHRVHYKFDIKGNIQLTELDKIPQHVLDFVKGAKA